MTAKRVLIGLTVAAVVSLMVLIVVPKWRIQALGRMHGERFIDEMPLSYWQEEIRRAVSHKEQSTASNAVLLQLLSVKTANSDAANLLVARRPSAEESTPALLPLLRGSDPDLQREAICALAGVVSPGKELVKALFELTLIEGNHASTARQTMTALGGQIVPAMLELVGSADETRKSSAIWWLSNAAQNHPEALNDDALALAKKILAAQQPTIASARTGELGLALEILGRMGPAAKETVPLILSQVGVENELAQKALVAIGVYAVPAVSAELGSGAPARRVAAARVICEIDPKAPPLLATLVGLLKTDEVPRGGIRNDAEVMLASLARDNPRALAEVIGLVDRPEFWSVESGARVLERLGPRAKPAVPNLLNVIAAESASLWEQRSIDAVRTLAAIGPDAKEALPVMIKLLANRNEMLADRVAEEIHHVGRAAIAPLTNILQNGPDDATRARAAKALASFGRDAQPARKALIGSLASEDWRLRSAAAVALGRIGPEAKEAIPLLLKQLACHSGDKFQADALRNSAAEALGGIGAATPDVVPALVAAQKDPMPDVRARAITSLVMIGEPARAAIPQIIAVMNSDESEGVRYHAADAITQLDPYNPAPRPVLERELLGDNAAHDAAVRAIARMKTAHPEQ